MKPIKSMVFLIFWSIFIFFDEKNGELRKNLEILLEIYDENLMLSLEIIVLVII